MTSFNPMTRRFRLGAIAVVVVAGGITLGACGGSGSSGSASSATTTNGSVASTQQVLPVAKNPITNASTAATLKLGSLLVDNNVDSKNAPVQDHLELPLTNTGTTPLSGFEIYYTFTDPKTKSTESYYTKLPDSFTIPAGGTRTVHFDNTGATDHFPVNQYSSYYTAKNPLKVQVMVSATGAAVQTATGTKTPTTGEVANQ